MGYLGIVNIDGTSHKVGSTLFGTCATEAATAAKVVTCSDFTELPTGVTIHVKFTYSNTAANPTLNINSKGAKPIYRYGTTTPGTSAETSWNAGAVISFTYDGSSFMMNDWVNTNTNTDTNVTQTATNTNANYEVLFSGTADNTTRTEGARKYSNLTFNPSTGTLTLPVVTSGTANIDTANITEDNVGNLIVTGAARFLNTINGSISGNAATASDAAKLNGYASDTAATNNTIARRTANGYIFATYFNQSSCAETPTSSSYIIYANSDGYFRKSTVANMKTAMSLNNVENKSSATIRGELTSANVTTALGYTPATSDHTHATSIATSTATNQITLAYGTKYAITAGGTSYVFTMPASDNTNTTYTIGTNGNNVTLTPSSGSVQSITVPYATSAGSAAPTAGSANYIQNLTGASRATTTAKSWASMMNSSSTGSPVLPTTGWWHVLSLDCWNSAPNNWVSQLAIATQDTSGVWYRKNPSSGTSIDEASWNRLAEGDASGNAVNANKVNNLTVQTAVPANAKFTDTTYSAGTGLALSGTTFRTSVPRVAKDSHALPGQNTCIVEEYANGTNYNLPSNHYYHIYSSQGSDVNYGCQLALGMTTAGAYYREYNNKAWGSWRSLINTDTNYYHTSGSWSGLTYTATANGGAGALAFTIPTGTSATTVAVGNHTHSYLPLSGGTLTGNLTISHAASATMTADSTNPKITFAENGTQPVHLIYTDYDNYRSPAGLKVIGGASATPAWFEVEGDIYEAGTKLSSKYLQLSGGTLTGNLAVTNVLGINASNGSSGGISLYAGTGYVDDYGICFRSTSNKGKHGYVTSDWATYFTMSNTNNRGWVFRRNGSGNVASIDTSGQMVLNGSLTLGGNEANTSGCRLVYNPIGSLDFVFV